MSIPTGIILLAIERAQELGDQAYAIHQDLEKWREVKYTDMERTKRSVDLAELLGQQRKWLAEIAALIQDYP